MKRARDEENVESIKLAIFPSITDDDAFAAVITAFSGSPKAAAWLRTNVYDLYVLLRDTLLNDTDMHKENFLTMMAEAIQLAQHREVAIKKLDENAGNWIIDPYAGLRNVSKTLNDYCFINEHDKPLVARKLAIETTYERAANKQSLRELGTDPTRPVLFHFLRGAFLETNIGERIGRVPVSPAILGRQNDNTPSVLDAIALARLLLEMDTRTDLNWTAPIMRREVVDALRAQNTYTIQRIIRRLVHPLFSRNAAVRQGNAMLNEWFQRQGDGFSGFETMSVYLRCVLSFENGLSVADTFEYINPEIVTNRRGDPTHRRNIIVTERELLGIKERLTEIDEYDIRSFKRRYIDRLSQMLEFEDVCGGGVIHADPGAGYEHLVLLLTSGPTPCRSLLVVPAVMHSMVVKNLKYAIPEANRELVESTLKGKTLASAALNDRIIFVCTYAQARQESPDNVSAFTRLFMYGIEDETLLVPFREHVLTKIGDRTKKWAITDRTFTSRDATLAFIQKLGLSDPAYYPVVSVNQEDVTYVTSSLVLKSSGTLAAVHENNAVILENWFTHALFQTSEQFEEYIETFIDRLYTGTSLSDNRRDLLPWLWSFFSSYGGPADPFPRSNGIIDLLYPVTDLLAQAVPAVPTKMAVIGWNGDALKHLHARLKAQTTYPTLKNSSILFDSTQAGETFIADPALKIAFVGYNDVEKFEELRRCRQIVFIDLPADSLYVSMAVQWIFQQDPNEQTARQLTGRQLFYIVDATLDAEYQLMHERSPTLDLLTDAAQKKGALRKFATALLRKRQ